jgi:outer membrane protein assembly factor BamB
MVTGFIYLILISGTVNAQDNLRQLLPTDEAAARHGLVRRWYSFAPVDGIRETVHQVTVSGKQVHLQTSASRIHVLDSETGKLLWSAQLGRPVPGLFGSAINANSVFAVNGPHLYRLNREDGSQFWSTRIPQVPGAAPAADEEHVIVTTREGRVYLFDANTKEVLWYYQTNAEISMPATLLDEKIACASQDGKLYIFQPGSRNPIHRYATGKPISAPMAAWGRTILLPSQDFFVYAVDVRTGDTMWRYSSGSEIRRKLTVIDNDVFVTPEDSGMHVLDAENGADRKWWHPRARDFVAATKNRVYAADKYGQLLTLDRATGRQISVWDTHQFDFRVHNDSTDRILLVTKSGMVVCLHEKENKEPLAHTTVQAPPPAGIEIKKPAKEPVGP